ncbi:PNK3P-domain-containing protein [Atractiella rhizophila]|nr:PNK3P-domain-containing protein [Atractiella rhizophila]
MNPRSSDVVEEVLKDGEVGTKVKIGAFDLDGTLIKTRSGDMFANDEADWMFWNPCVVERLRKLHEKGWNIVIVTNQNLPARIAAQWIIKAKAVLQEVNFVALSFLDVPLHLLGATSDDIFRKPCTGIWDVYLASILSISPSQVDMEASFYVGDAAGTVDPPDWADSDRKWAQNVDLPFFTPEEFFLNAPGAKYDLKGFNPHQYAHNDPFVYSPPPSSPEIVLFVGPPGSGKTTLYYREFKERGYEWVSQDVFKTVKGCVDRARDALEAGKSVVIDDVNQDRVTRSVYLSLPSLHKRILYLKVPLPLAKHNNVYGYVYKGKQWTPDVAYASWEKDLVAPTVEEGWDEVEVVQFVPFERGADNGRWRKWTWQGKSW